MELEAAERAFDCLKHSVGGERALAPQVAALEIELAAVRALAARRQDATTAALCRLRLVDLLHEIYRLQMGVFGYYALVDVEPLLLDNEGAIGPAGAARAARDYFGSFRDSERDATMDAAAQRLGIAHEHSPQEGEG